MTYSALLTISNYLIFISYMDKEGLAPALYLKRLGSAAGAAQVGLRRKSGMSIWLRENTGDFDETHSTNGVMAGTSNRK